MSTSLRRTYPKQLPASPGHGKTSTASPGPSATKRRALLPSFTPSARNCRARCPQTTPTSSTMYAAKNTLWSEILRSFTTVRATGRTPAPGMAARAVREAAVDHQRAEQLLESPELAWWSRHKARRALAEAGRPLRQSSRRLGEHRPAVRHAPRGPAGAAGCRDGSTRAGSCFPGGVLRRPPRGPEPPR